MSSHEINDSKKKNDFLSIYQTLRCSKTNKNSNEALDIERKCLALKYLSAKAMDSEETASVLLQASLQSYQEETEKLNYWNEMKQTITRTNNDCLNWTSGLEDPQVALKFVNALPCQKDNTLPCKQEIITNEHVQSIVDALINRNTSTRVRKISQKENKIADKPVGTKNTFFNTGKSTISTRLERCNDEYTAASCSKSTHNFYEPKQDNNTVDEKFNRFKSRPSFKISNDQSKFTRNDYKASDTTDNTFKPPVASLHEEDKRDNMQLRNNFLTAKQELNIQRAKQNRTAPRTLGGKKPINSQFVCPVKSERERCAQKQGGTEESATTSDELEDERLKNIDPKMVELIKNEIMDMKTSITWDDIAGLKYIKKIIQEVVVFPMLRPDIFTGLRRPPKGILLFGPPGTGKTLIGKCIASQSNSTFFSISASSLTSKWIGEGEKMVRALFAVARVHQPSVVFVDEIDSLLSQRSETEHESSRRLKTEFLVQLDGVATFDDDRILIVGATNRPHELDEAARRRLVKRLYVPLPEFEARAQIVNNLLASISNDLTEDEIIDIAERSDGYSGADMTNLCKEASMGPIRSIPFSQLQNISKEEVRRVTIEDFNEALRNVRPSVSQMDLTVYVEWDKTYGTGTALNSDLR